MSQLASECKQKKNELSLYHILTQEEHWKNIEGKASHWAELWILQGMIHLEYRE